MFVALARARAAVYGLSIATRGLSARQKKMRWIKPGFANSLHNFFAQTSITLRSQPTDCTEEIREAMIGLLGDRVDDRTTVLLVKRLRLATDVQDLWFARGNLMSTLAVLYGEGLARQKINALNALFEGQISPGLSAQRPRLDS